MQRPSTFLMVAMSALIVTSGLNWMEVRQLNRTMDERLDSIVNAIDRAGTKVEAAAKAPPTPAAAPPRSGPDPNKVYAIKTDRAPAKGPASALVTIAEFSDFQ